MEAGGQMFKWSGYRGYWEPRPPRQPSSFFTWNFFKSQRLLRCETCELDVQILMSFENGGIFKWLCLEARELLRTKTTRSPDNHRAFSLEPHNFLRHIFKSCSRRHTENQDHWDNHQALCWPKFILINILTSLYRVFFFNWPPLKSSKYKKVNLGEVKCI